VRRGFTIIGLLVVVAIMLVLYALTYESLRGVISGTSEDGVAVQASKSRMTDMFNLQQLAQGATIAGLSGGSGLPRPSDLTGDVHDDTTANVYALMVARGVAVPEMLISPLDEADVVPFDGDIPGRSDVPWNDHFEADLHGVSNVSYAHLVLHGDRAKHWSGRSLDSTMPLFSNRGPKDGVEHEDSLTCDPATGRWAGHVAFADGHVSLVQDAANAVRRGRGGSDHFFRIDDEDRHADAILGFTWEIDDDGPILQWD